MVRALLLVAAVEAGGVRNAGQGRLGGCCSGVAEVGVDGHRVVTLQGGGKLLDGVVVCSGLFS